MTVGGTTLTMPSDLNNPLAILDSGTTGIVPNTIANYNTILNALANSDIVAWTGLSNSEITDFWTLKYSAPQGSYTINQAFQVTFDFLGPNGESVPISVPASNWFTIQSNGYMYFSVRTSPFFLFRFFF